MTRQTFNPESTFKEFKVCLAWMWTKRACKLKALAESNGYHFHKSACGWEILKYWNLD